MSKIKPTIYPLEAEVNIIAASKKAHTTIQTTKAPINTLLKARVKMFLLATIEQLITQSQQLVPIIKSKITIKPQITLFQQLVPIVKQKMIPLFGMQQLIILFRPLNPTIKPQITLFQQFVPIIKQKMTPLFGMQQLIILFQPLNPTIKP
jgi:hypothetical protein